MGGLDLRLVNRFRFAALAALATVSLCFGGPAAAGRDPESAATWPGGTAVVSYESDAALRAALERHPARIVRRVPALRVVSVRPAGDVGAYAAKLRAAPGILGVDRAAARRSLEEPSLALDASSVPFQWQYSAIGADRVPADVTAAAAGITIAVVDTGADVTAPDLGAKQLHSYSVRRRDAVVADENGHGTFVAALAAGSATNGDGIAGIAGEAGLMVVQAGAPNGAFTDVDEAAAIVYAVDHGAKVINLSLGGPETSAVERRAVDYAVSKGALLVAAVGNGARRGNAIEYPAALLQPVGSRGLGGRGLSVAASTLEGGRASFSSKGSQVSLAAPGEDVFSAVATASPESRYPRTALPGSLGGLYGYASGTSFAAPQVAGAAALVWAANPLLASWDVASILEQTAGGGGRWNPELGFGIVDVAAAVERARTAVPTPAAFTPPIAPSNLPFTARRMGRKVKLTWRPVEGAVVYRIYARTKGKSRLLRIGARTTATFALARGSHELKVTAVDALGTSLAVSRPYRVQIPRR
jgi:subtilisin family serine protease